MNDIAIKVDHVSKTFKIPHEKVSSLRGAAVSLFRSGGYEEFKALDDVSFEVKKGEFFGIIGRNGSGKSTLLKILAGIYQADSGSMEINGMISPFLELGIGFNPELSGRDNIYLNATVLGLTKKEIDAKFDSIVAFSELERFIDQKLKNYSSGMQVRLAFSVSIHANREILLMDEVLAVGDTNFQSKCLEEFNKYKEAGKTVILVTHDIATVQRYCDRAMLLRNGKVVKIGKAEEVGNAYIYDNMSDEEIRMNNEQNSKFSSTNKGIGGSKSQKVAEITKVEFLDKNENKRETFITNDFMKARIYYKINSQKISKCNLGIAFLDDINHYIFVYNTDMDNFKLNLKKNCIDIIFEKFPLLKGTYNVNLAIFEKSGKVAYDFLPNFKNIKIYSENNTGLYGGILSIEHIWKQ